jgi:hypothetical protein
MKGEAMAEDRAKISTGPNERAVNEPIAGTAPGIPDEARGPGDGDLPEPPTDEEVARAAKALGAPVPDADES